MISAGIARPGDPGRHRFMVGIVCVGARSERHGAEIQSGQARATSKTRTRSMLPGSQLSASSSSPLMCSAVFEVEFSEETAEVSCPTPNRINLGVAW